MMLQAYQQGNRSDTWIPEYREYHMTQRSDSIIHIMKDVYYNFFFSLYESFIFEKTGD